MRYSIEPKDRIYVKAYEFLSFAKNMGTQLISKHSQKRLDSAKTTTDATKTASKRAVQKTVEATGDLIGNEIADKITSVSRKSKNHKIIKVMMNQKHQKKKIHISKKKATNY